MGVKFSGLIIFSGIIPLQKAPEDLFLGFPPSLNSVVKLVKTPEFVFVPLEFYRCLPLATGLIPVYAADTGLVGFGPGIC